jgi:hypothetical protein
VESKHSCQSRAQFSQVKAGSVRQLPGGGVGAHSMYAMQDHVRQVPVGNYWSRGTQKPRNLWHYQTFDEDSRQRRLDVCCSELSCV